MMFLQNSYHTLSTVLSYENNAGNNQTHLQALDKEKHPENYNVNHMKLPKLKMFLPRRQIFHLQDTKEQRYEYIQYPVRQGRTQLCNTHIWMYS